MRDEPTSIFTLARKARVSKEALYITERAVDS